MLTTAIGLKAWGAPQPTLNLGDALIRREAFEQVGFFTEDFAYAEIVAVNRVAARLEGGFHIWRHRVQ